jgi:hypothetical protein
LREGAAAASATVLYQTITWSGGSFSPGTALSVTGTALHVGHGFLSVNALVTFQTPFDFLIAAGSVLEIAPIDLAGVNETVFDFITIYIDEYHLARSV